MIIEAHGVEVFGRHGVNENERREGQPFLFDVTLEVEEPSEDEIGATVDYREVRDFVRELSEARTYDLLESLAAAVADALVSRFAVSAVRVRVRKPGIGWAEYAAASVERMRES